MKRLGEIHLEISDFDDDEYLVSDNDDLYDNYVDDNEEWVRIRGK